MAEKKTKTKNSAEEKKIDEKNEITWRAAEYEYSQKDWVWYAWVSGVAVVLVIFSIWQKNLFFGMFAVLAACMIVFFSRKKPRVLDFKINENEMRAGDNFVLTYDKLENFSIRSRVGHLDEIVVRKKATVNPFVRFPIDSKLALEAKKIIIKKLPEVEYSESIIDILSDRFGI